MSGNQIVWNGLEELRAQLRNLPADCAEEASGIVDEAAREAQATIEAGYPVVSGRLRAGLRVTHVHEGKYAAGAVLKNTAKHAWLYDNGSEARHYVSGGGARHATGKMWGRRPPTHLFVRTVIRARRRMYEKLKGLLTRKGFTVSGDA